MNSYDIYWAPEGRKIATVEAKDVKTAKKQTPLPYKKFLGEVYIKRTPNSFEARIVLHSAGFLLGGTRYHISTPFADRRDAESFGEQSIQVNRDRPEYRNADISCEIVRVYCNNPLPSTEVPA